MSVWPSANFCLSIPRRPTNLVCGFWMRDLYVLVALFRSPESSAAWAISKFVNSGLLRYFSALFAFARASGPSPDAKANKPSDSAPKPFLSLFFEKYREIAVSSPLIKLKIASKSENNFRPKIADNAIKPKNMTV